MRKLIVLTLCLLSMGLVAVNANASVTLINSYSTFLGYFPDALTENFEDSVLQTGLSIEENNGAGSIHNGVYENIVDVDSNRRQVFSFSGGIYGFGAWLDLAGPGGEGTGILVSIPDLGIDVGEVPADLAGQFWGFISTEPFQQVMFSDANHTDGGGVQETYYAIDLAYSLPVPIPAAAWLLGSGLLGLFAVRRRFHH